MTFGEAKLYFAIFHYLICISLLLSICLYRNRSILTFIYRLYGSIAIWACICYFMDGCPITMLENVISLHIYGQPFYENYGFHATDIKYLLTWPTLYYPLGMALIIHTITRIYNEY